MRLWINADAAVAVVCRVVEEDPQQLYSVLCGSVMLLHGSSTDPELQQLLHEARAEYSAACAEGCLLLLQQQQGDGTHAADTVEQAARSSDASGSGPALGDRGSSSTGGASTPPSRCPSGRSEPGTRSLSQPGSNRSSFSSHRCSSAYKHAAFSQPGVWQRVMAAVSQGFRLQIQTTMDAQASTLTTGPSAQLQQKQSPALHVNLQLHASAPLMGTAAAAGSSPSVQEATAGAHDSSLTISAAGAGQSFR
jgi:hypothetical protein